MNKSKRRKIKHLSFSGCFLNCFLFLISYFVCCFLHFLWVRGYFYFIFFVFSCCYVCLFVRLFVWVFVFSRLPYLSIQSIKIFIQLSCLTIFISTYGIFRFQYICLRFLITSILEFFCRRYKFPGLSLKK